MPFTICIYNPQKVNFKIGSQMSLFGKYIEDAALYSLI